MIRPAQLARWTATLLAVVASAGPVAGQDRRPPEGGRPEGRTPEGRPPRGPASRPDGDGEDFRPPRRGGPDRWHEGRPPGGPGRHEPRDSRFDRLVRGTAFEPGPEDLGPLQPGEAAELLAFAEDKLPFLARMLNRIEQRDPEAGERRLAAMAPRLRHLQRLFDQNPVVAEKLVQHGRNNMLMEELAGRARTGNLRPPERRRLMQDVRALNRENFELETEVLRAGLERLEDDAERGALVDRYLAGLLDDPQADASDEPARVQGALQRYRDAESESERAEIRSQLRAAMLRQVGDHQQRLRARFERRLASADEEVERRTRDVASGRPPRPGPMGHASPPPPPPGGRGEPPP